MRTLNCAEKVLELENHLIAIEQWDACDCKEAVKIAKESSLDGAPTGIGYKEDTGWFVLSTCGQGPMVLFTEN